MIDDRPGTGAANGVLSEPCPLYVQDFSPSDQKIAAALPSVRSAQFHCNQILEPRDRQFWRIKGFDDVRAIFETENLQVRERKVKRMAKVVHFSLCNSTELTSSQDVRKLEAASKRNVQAFSHILAVAYGRKGKLKRELMEVGV
jgi:hypothetical protein